MNITLPLYQQRRGRQLTWTSLGPGHLVRSVTGRNPAKMQRELIRELTEAMRDVGPEATAWVQQIGVPRLLRLKLELTLKGPDGRRKRTGRFPVVVTRRRVGPDRVILIAFHPMRQAEWMVVDDLDHLTPAFVRHVQPLWARLEDGALEALQTQGRDSIKGFAFDLDMPTRPLDEGGSDDPFADLIKDAARGGRSRRDRGRLVVLPELATDLTVKASHDDLEAGMPRPAYQHRLQHLLCGPIKRSTVLIGPPGCGRRTLLRRLVHDLLAAEDYESHLNLQKLTHAWALSGQRLIAGMSHVGEWEARCEALVGDCEHAPAIVWIDDLAAFTDLGRARDSERSFADYFRGPLHEGLMTMVGVCTPNQWQRLEARAPEFASAFTPVPVHPASPDETLSMLITESRGLEARLDIEIHPMVPRAALEMSGGLFPQAAWPGKALDLLARSCRALEPRDRLTPKVLVAHLSARTGIPAALLNPEERWDLDEVRQAFDRRIMGQPEALQTVLDLIARIRAGLTDPRRPLGVYLFTGPTGTGKTEMARCLADYLYGDPARLVRFDMSEFNGPDAVTRLIGSTWRPRGVLTDRVRVQPFSVVLLDEIEKAHPSVYNLLLQLFEEGRLTDAAGDVADFTHAVVIMTSNLGAKTRATPGFGQADVASITRDMTEAVRRFFAPELFNRIDTVVPFRPLVPEAAERIVAKEIAHLTGRRGLAARQMTVEVHPGVYRHIVEAAFDPRDGARPLKRYLEHSLGAMLVEEMTRGSGSGLGGALRRVRIFPGAQTAEDPGFTIEVDQAEEADPTEDELMLEGLMSAPMADLKAALDDALSLLDEGETHAAVEHINARVTDLMGDLPPEATPLAEADPSQISLDRLYALDSLRGLVEQARTQLASVSEAEANADALEQTEEALRAVEKRTEYGGYNKRLKVLRSAALASQGSRQGPFKRLQALDLLAHVGFLRRLVQRADEPGIHDAIITLWAVGTRAVKGFKDARVPLLQSLAFVYSRGQGRVSEVAVVQPGGEVAHRTAERSLTHMRAIIQPDIAGAVIRVSAMGAALFYDLEAGAHWLETSSGYTELVQVGVHRDDGRPLTDWVQAHLDARQAFGQAMSGGRSSDRPADPDALMPLTRRYRFDSPPAGERASLIVEDYRLGQVVERPARNITEALPDLWRLAMSRVPAGGEA